MTVNLDSPDITIGDPKLVVTAAVQQYLNGKGTVTDGEGVVAVEVALLIAVASLEARFNALVEAVGGEITTDPAKDILEALRDGTA